MDAAGLPQGLEHGIFNDEFGSSVAVSGNTLVVGAWQEFGTSSGINGNQTDKGKRGAV